GSRRARRRRRARDPRRSARDASCRSRWPRTPPSACPAAGRRRASRRAWGCRSRHARSFAGFYTGAPLRLELPLLEKPQAVERDRLSRGLGVANVRDPRKSQREPRGIGGTLLDLVVLDLDDDLGPHPHRIAVVVGGELPEPLGHLAELCVGESLERLADVRKAVAVAHREVIVGQPANASAGPTVDGDDHAVDRPRRFELDPALATTAGLVRAREVLGHDTLVPRRERRGAECRRLRLVAHDAPLGEIAAAGDRGQRLPASLVWLV